MAIYDDLMMMQKKRRMLGGAEGIGPQLGAPNPALADMAAKAKTQALGGLEGLGRPYPTPMPNTGFGRGGGPQLEGGGMPTPQAYPGMAAAMRPRTNYRRRASGLAGQLGMKRRMPLY